MLSGSGSGLKKFMDPDPVYPERLNPDPVSIRRIRNPVYESYVRVFTHTKCTCMNQYDV